MIKNIVLSISFISCILLPNPTAAQVAARKGVTLNEVYEQINNLAIKHDAESKALLALEAKELVKSDNEQWILLGATIYESLQNKAEVEKAQKTIKKRFPNGKNARFEEFNKIFNSKPTITTLEVEKLHKNWETRFPPNSFAEQDRNMYIEADANMAILFFNENNIEKGNSYIERFKSNPNYPIYINKVGSELIKKNNYLLATTLLEPAYVLSLEATKPNSIAQNKTALARSYYNIAPNYANSLLKDGKTEQAITVLEELINKTSNVTASLVKQLVEAYAIDGRDLDAFILLHNYQNNNEVDERLSNLSKSLYLKLNQNNEGNINEYFSSLTEKSTDALFSKYKAEMIKKEAINFSLLNMKGDTISLADMKGKVVILDFWATWCGPCKASFPGMQATINKYKNDKEVEFLFIDVWQKEDNYKELAQKFIIKNQYTFNVLFDEMKDRAKSTATAYGVRGIPTKIIIDKEGFIRFESSGGGTEVYKVVNEMTAKIELAKKG